MGKSADCSFNWLLSSDHRFDKSWRTGDGECEAVAVAALGERAVVLGASMDGLLAARVLADFYETVTVVEP